LTENPQRSSGLV